MRTKMKKLAVLVVVLAALVSLPMRAYTQQSPPSSAVTIIDGSQHPELIPDALAYRLYFLAVTSLPPTIRQDQLTYGAGVFQTNLQAATTAIVAFRTAYDSLSNSYNQQVQAGSNPNPNFFASQRDALVANARAALQKILSPTEMQSFDAHVQGEKTKMKTSGVTTAPTN